MYESSRHQWTQVAASQFRRGLRLFTAVATGIPFGDHQLKLERCKED